MLIKKKVVKKLVALSVAMSMFCAAIPCYADEDYMVEEDISSLVTSNDNLKCIKANENEVGYSTKVSENMEYSCTFDMDNLRFCFVETVSNSNGKAIEQKKTYTNAIITENGGLDPCIKLSGNTYMLSDFKNNGTLTNRGGVMSGLIKAVNVYLSVADTAEKIKAVSNYKYNRKLESKGKGVGKGCYVTNQSETETKNKRSGNYRFGFTKFKNVGCEVAAVYNAMISLGRPERLSQTIYCFEAWSIEFASGWGKLGSNPLEISRYLKKKKVSYKKYTSFSSLKKAVAKRNKCRIIMSTWNKPITDGLHTFFVYKANKNLFKSYNWGYDFNPINKNILDEFNNGSGFIVGYLVWK